MSTRCRLWQICNCFRWKVIGKEIFRQPGPGGVSRFILVATLKSVFRALVSVAWSHLKLAVSARMNTRNHDMLSLRTLSRNLYGIARKTSAPPAHGPAHRSDTEQIKSDYLLRNIRRHVDKAETNTCTHRILDSGTWFQDIPHFENWAWRAPCVYLHRCDLLGRSRLLSSHWPHQVDSCTCTDPHSPFKPNKQYAMRYKLFHIQLRAPR